MRRKKRNIIKKWKDFFSFSRLIPLFTDKQLHRKVSKKKFKENTFLETSSSFIWMDAQLHCIAPIPILQEIIRFSNLRTRFAFCRTCKLFRQYVYIQIYPILTIRLIPQTPLTEPLFGTLDPLSGGIYFSDCFEHCIKKLDPISLKVEIICGSLNKEAGCEDGIGANARFFYPRGLAADSTANLLYVADETGNIKKIELQTFRVTTLYKYRNSCYPQGLVLDTHLQQLYTVNCRSNTIEVIFLNEKRIETLCGTKIEGYADGTFNEAQFHEPTSIVLNSKTQELYITDRRNHVIRCLSLKNKMVTTLCGTQNVGGYKDGTFSEAKFYCPFGLALDSLRNCLYVADEGNHVVRKIFLCEQKRVITLREKEDDKHILSTKFSNPKTIIVDPTTATLYVFDSEGGVKILDHEALLSSGK